MLFENDQIFFWSKYIHLKFFLYLFYTFIFHSLCLMSETFWLWHTNCSFGKSNTFWNTLVSWHCVTETLTLLVVFYGLLFSNLKSTHRIYFVILSIIFLFALESCHTLSDRQLSHQFELSPPLLKVNILF